MKDDREICGTCKYHCHTLNVCYGGKHEVDEWACDNLESDYYTFITEYTDSCMDYERREQ